jgi:hypothetical protein
MSDADGIVLEALLDDVLDLSLIRDAIDEALELVCGQTVDDPREQVETELANVNRERDRLVASIAAGGELAGLLEALRTREEHRASLEVERRSIAARQRTQATDATRVREELTDLAGRWRKVLAGDPEHARPILSRLLVGRVTFTPIERHRWEMKGEGTLAGLFTRELFPSVWRPQRDSHASCAPQGLELPQQLRGRMRLAS